MEGFGKSSLIFLLICSPIIPATSQIIDTSHPIKDGETLVSSGGIFELGFFSTGNSSIRYLGIWYKNITARTYVWVANRQVPLTTDSGELRITEPGILALFDRTNGTIVWSSNASRAAGNPSAELLDTGNLVVKDADEDRLTWQSFDYPSDTLLAGMSLGWNYRTGLETYLTSWRSSDDPGLGVFTFHLDPSGYPQLLVKRGSTVKHRVGPWNGLRMSGAPDTSKDPTTKVMLRMNRDGVRYSKGSVGQAVISRSTLNFNGVGQRFTWNPRTLSWTGYTNTPVDNCDTYSLCGVYSSCNIGNSPSCGCLHRFVPKDEESWIGADWSSGCVRRTALNCTGDVFLLYSGLKLPDSQNSTFNDQIVLLADCEAECSRNCSCTAYARLNISGSGSGCLFYHGDLIDIRTMAQAGQDIFIRMASSESPTESSSKGRKRVILIASLMSIAGIILVCISLHFVFNSRKKDTKLRKQVGGSHGNGAELPFFNFTTILKATDNFSIANKLGQGGFGSVYRGMLKDGQEIAVKRLSKTSSQGVKELKNEVMLIAKLQHRNLVKLLGCCIEREENMLVYEFMANSSLDLILFDQTKIMLLDWRKRFHIITGIAKGLLYLHQDSRLRIIHRDLKPSNILLDADMNPKISDFGLAKSFGGNETEAKTHRVVGTLGYMSPEYAIDGLFSVKSDVFSFGILVLEVVCGMKSRGLFTSDSNLNLLGYAWTLYKENKLRRLVDASLGSSFDLSQALRAIHVGLLCVQKSPEDRPSMSSVVFMLGNEVQLPQPKQPGFFTESTGQSSPTPNAADSENQVTTTLPQGR